MAQQFPTFKYSDVKFDPKAFTDNASLLAPPGASVSSFYGASTSPLAPKTEMGELLAFVREQSGPAATEQKLKQTLEFQKQQMKQAAPYKLLFELPGQITRAFAAPGEIRLAGALAANQLVAEGIRGAAAADIPPLNYQRPNIQYF
jgi:hypothetical protein